MAVKLPHLTMLFSPKVAFDGLVDPNKAHSQKNIKDSESIRENSRLTQRSAHFKPTALYA